MSTAIQVDAWMTVVLKFVYEKLCDTLKYKGVVLYCPQVDGGMVFVSNKTIKICAVFFVTVVRRYIQRLGERETHLPFQMSPGLVKRNICA